MKRSILTSKAMTTLTHDRLKELIDYDPDSGQLHWKVDRHRAKAGAIAGSIVESAKIWQVGIDGVRHSAAKLAWFFATGTYPEHPLRYGNGDFLDVRIINLSYRGEHIA